MKTIRIVKAVAGVLCCMLLMLGVGVNMAVATQLGPGVTKDPMHDNSLYLMDPTPGYGTMRNETTPYHPTYYNVHDPLDPNDYTNGIIETWGNGCLFTYGVPAGYRISRVRVSFSQYPPIPATDPIDIGIADSLYTRIAPEAYVYGTGSGQVAVASALSYTNIIPTYTLADGATNNWAYYIMDVSLPYMAESLVDNHPENFRQISLGYYDLVHWSYSWAYYKIGTVELTVTNNYLPGGVWLDRMVYTNMWDVGHPASMTAPTIDGTFTLDPLDSTYGSYVIKEQTAGAQPALFSYRAQEDMWIQKVRMSICVYTNNGTWFPEGVGIADSTGYRVTSVDYTGSPKTSVDTAPSYGEITPTYTVANQPVVGGQWRWYIMEANLPYSATSLIDGHREVFDRISVGFWQNYGPGWAMEIGAVELTVVPRPPRGSVVMFK